MGKAAPDFIPEDEAPDFIPEGIEPPPTPPTRTAASPQAEKEEGFWSRLGTNLNPLPLIKTGIELSHPLPARRFEAAKNLYEGAVEGSSKQWEKAGEAYNRGVGEAEEEGRRNDISPSDKARSIMSAFETVGHGAAALVPFIGPGAAETGGRIAKGNWKGAAGDLLALAVPSAAGRLLGKTAKAAAPANLAVALRRSPLGKAVQAEQAAQDLIAINQPPPVQSLNPAARGSLVAQAERQALLARTQQAEKLYSPMKDVQVSIRQLLDDDFEIVMKEAGAQIPPNVANPLKRAKAEHAKLPKVNEGELVTSDALEKALLDLDNIPFSEVRKLRTEVGMAARRAQGNAKFAADNMYKKLSAFLEDAAEGAGLKSEWDAANAFYRDEVVLNHKTLGKGDVRKPSLGKQMQKKAPAHQTLVDGRTVDVGGTPEKMHQVLSPANPQDVVGAHRALVPRGSWVSRPAIESGQRAFDNLVEQAVEARFPLDASGSVDPAQISGAIRTKVGTAAWEEMKNLSSPAQRARLESLERVGAAFEKLAPPPASLGEAILPNVAAGIGGMLGGRVGAMIGTAVGAGRSLSRLKPAVLRWAIQHPARTEVLINGMNGTIDASQLGEYATRNVSNIIRLYNMDTMRPPAPEKSGLKAVNQ